MPNPNTIALEMATGVLHAYTGRLVAFEHGTASYPNVLLFVGGLGDGLQTVPYVPLLAEKLAAYGWAVAQILISSSYIGWGTGSLMRDSQEIEQAVAYFRKQRSGKIALMGHSTGCQDTMQYLVRRPNPNPETRLDGAILQAPVSDREAMLTLFPDTYDSLLDYALKQQASGKGNDVLPSLYSDLFFNTPISAARWISLAKKNGDDDYFSSDLDDKSLSSTFAAIDAPLLILVSGSDEFMPASLDKTALVNRWKTFVKPQFWTTGSGTVAGGKHNLGEGSESGAAEDAVARVSLFLSQLTA